MSIFFSPRYNVGERLAGGSIAIFTDRSMKSLVPLWQYSDLKTNPVDGSGAISNPQPVDNNGINASPIFYDNTLYPKAWYVLRDANNAQIRAGYVMPTSWMDGGSGPAPEGAGFGSGDDLWGYEVIPDLNTLTQIPLGDSWPYMGRPVFLGGFGDADGSGGLIVYATQGIADNVLSYPSSKAGVVWKARERLINASFFANRSITDPYLFLYINSLQGTYEVNLDVNVKHDLAAPKGFAQEVHTPLGSTAVLTLTNSSPSSTGGFYVKPSPSIQIDNTFYATNAEAYSLIKPASVITPRLGNIAVNSQGAMPPTQSSINDGPGSANWGNVHIVGVNAEGVFKPRSEWANLICLNSPRVEIKDSNTRLFVLDCLAITNSTYVNFDITLNDTLLKRISPRSIHNSSVRFGYWIGGGWQPLNDSSLTTTSQTSFVAGFMLKGTKITQSTLTLEPGSLYLADGAEIDGCTVIGENWWFTGLNTVTTTPTMLWTMKLFLCNGATVKNSSLGGLLIGFIGKNSDDGKRTSYKGIHFDSNIALPASTYGVAFLNMPSSNNYHYHVLPRPSDSEEINYTDFTIINSKGSGEDAFVVNTNSFSQNTKLVSGHLEIQGWYDYGLGNSGSNPPTPYTGNQNINTPLYPTNLLPTETFPVKGKNVPASTDSEPNGNQINWNNGNLCFSAWGDPLKYSSPNDYVSLFVTADPWYRSDPTSDLAYNTGNVSAKTSRAYYDSNNVLQLSGSIISYCCEAIRMYRVRE